MAAPPTTSLRTHQKTSARSLPNQHDRDDENTEPNGNSTDATQDSAKRDVVEHIHKHLDAQLAERRSGATLAPENISASSLPSEVSKVPAVARRYLASVTSQSTPSSTGPAPPSTTSAARLRSASPLTSPTKRTPSASASTISTSTSLTSDPPGAPRALVNELNRVLSMRQSRSTSALPSSSPSTAKNPEGVDTQVTSTGTTSIISPGTMKGRYCFVKPTTSSQTTSTQSSAQRPVSVSFPIPSTSQSLDMNVEEAKKPIGFNQEGREIQEDVVLPPPILRAKVGAKRKAPSSLHRKSASKEDLPCPSRGQLSQSCNPIGIQSHHLLTQSLMPLSAPAAPLAPIALPLRQGPSAPRPCIVRQVYLSSELGRFGGLDDLYDNTEGDNVEDNSDDGYNGYKVWETLGKSVSVALCAFTVGATAYLARNQSMMPHFKFSLP